MKNKEELIDILLKVSELEMDVETAEKKILKMFIPNKKIDPFDDVDVSCPICGCDTILVHKTEYQCRQCWFIWNKI